MTISIESTLNPQEWKLPETMRAAVLMGSEPILEVLSIPVPRPRPGEALVRVIACGVCHTDLHVMKSEVQFPRPAVLGHEISGTVVEIAEGTRDRRGVSEGDTVVGAFIMPCGDCPACRAGRDDMCAEFFAQNRLKGTLYDGESRLRMPDGSFLGMYSMGGLAEYCVIPLTALTALPAGVDATTACVLGCAGLTAYGAVCRAARLARGESIAIIGTGGIGSSIIQIAKAVGARQIVAIDIAAGKLERAARLGATDLVDASKEDPVRAVHLITEGGVDVAFEALGLPATFRQSTEMLTDGGRMVAIGIAAGRATAEVEITPLVRRGYQIIGSFGGRTRQDLPKLIELQQDGYLDPAQLITAGYRLEDAAEAYRALDRGEIAGRAIVTM
jgi:Zn-dependent alcohol dehydrogenase